MKAAFNFELGSEISPGLVTVGRFDGRHPSLAAATPTGKLVLHSPHQNSQYGKVGRDVQGAVRHLKINNNVTAVAAACLDPSTPDSVDSLLIGTQTTLQAYNVEENRDLFFSEVSDGITTISCGYLGGMSADGDAAAGRSDDVLSGRNSSVGSSSKSSSGGSGSGGDSGGGSSSSSRASMPPTVFAGGDLSIHGFNSSGEEIYWTVTGGNIGAMTLLDVNGDGVNELVVGSDDYEIRTFKGEEVISETTETGAVSHLCPMTRPGVASNTPSSMFAYGLKNGTLGVYNGASSRVWRMKSKNSLMSVTTFDIDGDGVNEVCSGWSNGKFEVRRDRDGTMVFKDRLNAGVAGLVVGDYRLDGAEQIVVCTQSGEVRGYLPFEGSAGTQMLNEKKEDVAVNELLTEKQELLLKLRGIEGNVKHLKSGEPLGAGVIDPTTKVSLTTQVNRSQRCVDLVVSTNNETVVRCAVTYNLEGGILDGESYVVHPSTPSTELRIPLRPQKDVETKLDVHAMVGARGNSSQYHVFELVAKLPKFTTLVGDVEASTSGGSRARRRKKHGQQQQQQQHGEQEHEMGTCIFYLNERVDRVHQWAMQAFLGLGDGKTGALRGGTKNLELDLLSLRTGDICQIDMVQESTGNKVTVYCNSMEVVGDVVQDLCRSLSMSLLESTANFPRDFHNFQEILEKVEKHKQLRGRMTADMADMSHSIKSLVIRAEDSRVLCDWNVSLFLSFFCGSSGVDSRQVLLLFHCC